MYILSPAKQHTGCRPSSSSEVSRRCAIAVQHSDGRAVVINVTIKEEVNGNLIFSSAKEQLSRALAKSWYQKLIGRLLMGLVVGTAKVSQLIHFDSPPPFRLCLQDFTPDPLLTSALHNPHLQYHPGDPSHRTGLFGSPQQLISAQPPAYDFANASDNQEIIVVKRTIDRAKIARLLLSLLLFWPALGLVVGVCAHDAEVGIAVSAGVFAMATFVQGLVAWVVQG